jgi:hypothetical protein
VFKQVFAAAAVMALSACPTAFAAALKKLPGNDGRTIVALSGEIQQGDSDSLTLLIKSENDAGRLVHAIRLSSPGGNLMEGVMLAEIVKQGKISTSVLNGSQCASACFIVFAAGTEKFANYGALIGVHGASDKSGRESGTATVSMARIVKDFGVPAGIIGKMVVTPPDEMVWLSPDDLRSMSTTMTGKPDQTKQNTAAPQQLVPKLDSSANAVTKPIPTWGQLVDRVVEASAKQNNGKANFQRSCQPEMKRCYMAIFYNDKNGMENMIRTAEDMSGKIVKRDVCEFNKFKDVRTCFDWDTGEQTRSMKDPKGDWIKVADD